jgi:hypothetical protein
MYGCEATSSRTDSVNSLVYNSVWEKTGVEVRNNQLIVMAAIIPQP